VLPLKFCPRTLIHYCQHIWSSLKQLLKAFSGMLPSCVF
jgi:hypothetical protein